MPPRPHAHPNGIHRIINGAAHMSFAFEHEKVQATNTAILQVVEAARTGHLYNNYNKEKI